MKLTYRQQAEIILIKKLKGCQFEQFELDCKDCIVSLVNTSICSESILEQAAAKFILTENLKLL